MFDYKKPEEMGVSSASIKEFIEALEKSKLITHDIIIARGNSIVFENYWEPFDKDFLHRMYSVTKSFVSIAIGFLEQDGLISLDDKIIKYFPDEMKNQKDENFRNQTIRHMLMMSTAKVERNWFNAKPEDRVKFYFENDIEESRPSGTIYQYDSGGSFIMGTLVERVTGKKLIEYLREKCLDKIGFSKEAKILKCPGGHSWSDSALLCKPTDLLKTARFMMNGGKWNTEQLLNEEYVKKATARQIDNFRYMNPEVANFGYGYQFWMTRDNSFFFNGMGSQLAVCVPDKDMILIYNGDNQFANVEAKSKIINTFFEKVIYATDNADFQSADAYNKLMDYSSGLKLYREKDNVATNIQADINGKVYSVMPNPMGITRFKLTFSNEEGCFEYTNNQGDKAINFGICKNTFGYFPEEGYSKEVGTVNTKGHFYKMAASASWIEEKKLHIKVQIIDEYLGTLEISIGFRDNIAGIFMEKVAEDFLDSYQGYATAYLSE